MHNAMHILFTNINDQIWLLRNLIRIIDSCKSLDLTPSSPFVNPLPIRSFLLKSTISPEQGAYAVFEGSSNVNEIKISMLRNLITSGRSSVFKRGDRGRDHGGTGTSEFTTDKGYSCDVLGSIFARKAKFGREFGTHGVAQEKGDRPPGLLI